MLLTTRAFLLACILLLPVGCSSKQEAAPQQVNLLREVDGMLRMANGRKISKGPEFTNLETNFPLGAAAVKSGDIVVLWGVKMASEDGSGATGEVVAYEKVVPTAGGYVLLQNGQVKKMTTAEFEAAPKPKQ